MSNLWKWKALGQYSVDGYPQSMRHYSVIVDAETIGIAVEKARQEAKIRWSTHNFYCESIVPWSETDNSDLLDSWISVLEKKDTQVTNQLADIFKDMKQERKTIR
jgi:hypothetical protein